MQESQASQASRINADVELEAIYKNLQAKKSYMSLKEQLFQRLLDSKVPKAEWVTQIPRLAASSQIESKLKQVIYDISNTIIKPDPIRYDTVDTINQARQFWTEFLVQNLIKVSNKLLERLSNPDTNRKSQEEHENLSIFNHRNLYAVCSSTCILRGKRSLSNPGDVKMAERITFDPIPMDQLKEMYEELLFDDNNLIGDDMDEESLIIEREKEAENLIQKVQIN